MEKKNAGVPVGPGEIDLLAATPMPPVAMDAAKEHSSTHGQAERVLSNTQPFAEGCRMSA